MNPLSPENKSDTPNEVDGVIKEKNIVSDMWESFIKRNPTVSEEWFTISFSAKCSNPDCKICKNDN